jgi:hypothetical protein
VRVKAEHGGGSAVRRVYTLVNTLIHLSIEIIVS